MRIQHNIMSMNAYRNYTSNVSAMKANLEKLSSGYKINRAGDDAAGLAISEKMRAQITGLKQAQNNAKSGINLVQTAEGALQEVQDMLNRMVKLAEQSANGTYDDNVDRNQLNKEFKKLTEEIDRINQSANFNGISLFGGAGTTDATTTDATTYPEVTVAKWAGAAVTGADVAAVPAKDAEAAVYTYKITTALDGSTGKDTKISLAGQDIEIGTGETIDTTTATTADDQAAIIRTELGKVTAITDKYTVGGTGAEITLTAKTAGVDADAATMKAAPQITNGGTAAGAATGTETTKGAAAVAAVPAHKSYDLSGTPAAGDKVTIDGKEYTFKTGADGTDGATFSDLATLKTAAEKNGVTLNTDDATKVVASKTPKAQAGAGGAANAAANSATPKGTITLQIGDTNADYNQLKVNLYDIGSKALKDLTEGTNKTLSQLSVDSETNAGAALKSLKGMVNYISDIRGELGATQNRLDHTIKNLSVMEENIQDAESTIRDTDVADEMMAYTKNNILIQSAQAMLAQANQVPQGVLQLLQ